MINELQTLAESGPNWAQKRASMALQINEQFQGGGLEELEFQEMMLRLIEDGPLDREADNLDTKALLVTAIQQVANI
jgi:hypothetical protein|tara:strand:- start:120 stop:350 length:231 start_codon:yes stop_codon:yes gene_type:complete